MASNPTPNCSKKCEKLQPLSSVIMKTAAVLCGADGSQFTVTSLLLKNITNAYPVGPFAQNVYYERCSLLFTPTLHVVFAKHPKTRNHIAENGSIFGRDKSNTFLRNVSFVQNRRIDCIRLRWWWALPTEIRLGQKAREGQRRSLSRTESFSRA